MFSQASKFFLVLKPEYNSLLLSHFEKYVNGAVSQVQRVERIKKVLSRERNTQNLGKRLNRLFLDAHFYFICIGHIDRSLKKLGDNLRNQKLKDIYAQFKKDFDKEIRDDLEHLDERILGKRRGKPVSPAVKKSWYKDLVNFWGDQLSFGGNRYPVNRTAIKKLTTIYKDVVSVIRKDYALKDPNFVRMENTFQHIKFIKRTLKTTSKS